MSFLLTTEKWRPTAICLWTPKALPILSFLTCLTPLAHFWEPDDLGTWAGALPSKTMSSSGALFANCAFFCITTWSLGVLGPLKPFVHFCLVDSPLNGQRIQGSNSFTTRVTGTGGFPWLPTLDVLAGKSDFAKVFPTPLLVLQGGFPWLPIENWRHCHSCGFLVCSHLSFLGVPVASQSGLVFSICKFQHEQNLPPFVSGSQDFALP